MINVLLLGDLSREPARLLVKGLSRFSNSRGGWRFYQVPPAIRDSPCHISKIVSMVHDLEIDAIFGQWKGIDVSIAKQLGIPVVLYQRREMVTGFPIVHCDNDAVGKMAAGFFLRYADMHLTFCGFKGVVWSDERIRAYQASAGDRIIPGFYSDDSGEDWMAMRDWLQKLPKPAGIFCCNDVNAKMLIEVCISSGLRIPEDVSVLGVDNDSFTCNITSPTISTIELEFERVGYRIGQYINDKLNIGDGDSGILFHSPAGIVERESTPRLQTSDEYVKRVMDFMKKHFTEDIGVNDIIRDIPLSRRSVEMRFKNAYGDKTMHRVLLEMRVERMKELLVRTDLPIFNIALMAGFKDNTNINRVFRNIVGYSPKEYRETHR